MTNYFYTHIVPLRWRDMDSYVHVNNSEYLTLCEEARIAWFRSLNGPWRSANAEPVVARIELDYKLPLTHPNDVTVRLALDRLGNASLSLTHSLSAPNEAGVEMLYAVGKTVLVWTDPQTGKSTPVPDLVRQSVQR
jgi:acyl-CoA thioester hydrolase